MKNSNNKESKSSRPYVIYAPSDSGISGGSIVLHQLCKELNSLGQKAYIWPSEIRESKPGYKSYIAFFEWKLKQTRQYLMSSLKKSIVMNKANIYFDKLSNIFWLRRILNSAIVIYPEITAGNPLNAQNVVRWFLHKPGYHTGEINFGSEDLFFYYSPQFNDRNLDQKFELKIMKVLDDIYFNYGNQNRTGTCYIIRKGHGRTLVHDLNDSVLIDELSHVEAAQVFNRTKYCYSYDTQTMLSHYAAMCGCISIVMPEEGLTKNAWKPNQEDRYGIAYGIEDFEWSINTQNMVLPKLKEQQQKSIEQVKNFIKITQENYLKQQ